MIRLLSIMGIAVFFIYSLSSLSFSQEQLTITTYYPSPVGSYRELRIEGSVVAGQPAPGVYFRRTDVAPAGQDHWRIVEEEAGTPAVEYLVFRDLTETWPVQWWGIALDRTDNNVLLNWNYAVQEVVLRIADDGNIYWNKDAEGTPYP